MSIQLKGSKPSKNIDAITLVSIIATVFFVTIDCSGLLDFLLYPFASALILLGIALRKSPRKTLKWGIVSLCMIAMVSILNLTLWKRTSLDLGGMMAVRFLSACVFVYIAFVVSDSLNQAKQDFSQLCSVFDQLNRPFLIADPDGWIIYLNPAAESKFESKVSCDTPFFESFNARGAKGHLIQSFLDLASGTRSGPLEYEVECRFLEKSNYSMALDRISLLKSSYVVAIFSPATNSQHTPVEMP